LLVVSFFCALSARLQLFLCSEILRVVYPSVGETNYGQRCNVCLASGYLAIFFFHRAAHHLR
jgi:hypothetical protein